MKQFRIILSYELKNYFKDKIFIGITLAIVSLFAIVMFFPRVMDLLQLNNGEKENQDTSIILVSAPSPELGQDIVAAFSSAFPDQKVILSQERPEQIKQAIISEDADVAFIFDQINSYICYVNNRSPVDQTSAIAEQVVLNLAQTHAITQYGLTPQQASQILSPQIHSSVESLGIDQTHNFWYTYIMIFALYIAIILYGQLTATRVATEKSSRAMELLITSAAPSSMMFGKILAACIAGFTQLVLFFGSALLFYQLNQPYWGDNVIVTSFFKIPPVILVYMLLFFVLGFLLYAFMFGAIGSMASKVEDINTTAGPIIMVFVIAVFFTAFNVAAGSVNNWGMILCSFIPFTSPLAMFARIAMSSVPIYQIILSIGILIASVIGVGILSGKIYRVGVLLYGTPPKLRSILKSIFAS